MKGISTLSIRSYLQALRYLLIIFKIASMCLCDLKSFCFDFDLTLASVFKSVTKLFLKTLLERSVSVKKFVWIEPVLS